MKRKTYERIVLALMAIGALELTWVIYTVMQGGR